MAVFFFLVGLEIKREVLVGELASMRQAALPMAAALGGMVVPALLYPRAQRRRSGRCAGGASRWRRTSPSRSACSRCSATACRRRSGSSSSALAIADDLGAVLVIALFYTAGVSWSALAAAGGLLLLSLAANAIGVRAAWAYALIGLALWAAVLLSGVHATVAGVLLAMTIPSRTADRRARPAGRRARARCATSTRRPIPRP